MRKSTLLLVLLAIAVLVAAFAGLGDGFSDGHRILGAHMGGDGFSDGHWGVV